MLAVAPHDSTSGEVFTHTYTWSLARSLIKSPESTLAAMTSSILYQMVCDPPLFTSTDHAYRRARRTDVVLTVDAHLSTPRTFE